MITLREMLGITLSYVRLGQTAEDGAPEHAPEASPDVLPEGEDDDRDDDQVEEPESVLMIDS